MTQEDKELLIKDLCARLSYGVKVKCYGFGGECIRRIVGMPNSRHITDENDISWNIVEEIKPYLFPMSSMTEEQEIQLSYLSNDIIISNNGIRFNRAEFYIADLSDVFDWLNAHHFDYRGLIDKGLAIDATNLNIY